MELVSLQKGERVDLTKSNPGVTRFSIGLGWDVNAGNSGTFDLDAIAFELKGGKLLSGSNSILYFGNKEITGMKHMGDNLTGAGDGDDETINVDLSVVPADCDEILIGVNIYQAAQKRQNFGMVNNAFIRIYNTDDAAKTTIQKYDLSEDYSSFNAVIFGKLYKKDGEWKFQAIGEGKNGDINELAAQYN